MSAPVSVISEGVALFERLSNLSDTHQGGVWSTEKLETEPLKRWGGFLRGSLRTKSSKTPTPT